MWHSSAFLQAASIATAALCQVNAAPSVKDVYDHVRISHESFLKQPGGAKIDYTISVTQRKDSPVFAWPNGLKGTLAVRWPELLSVVEGDFSGIYNITPQGEAKLAPATPRYRKGYYNFDTGVSIGVDGADLGQVLKSRHGYSSVNCFPLILQCYAEADQYYESSSNYSDAFLLPHALARGNHLTATDDVVNGVQCVRVENPGVDIMWFAKAEGYCLLKRESRFGKGKPVKERIENSDLKEIAAGLWWPMRGEFTAYSHDSVEPSYSITLDVKRISLGNIAENDVRLALDESLRQAEDLITGRVFEPIDLEARIEEEVAVINASSSLRRQSMRRCVALANLAIVLSVAAFYCRRRVLALNPTLDRSRNAVGR